MLANGIFYIHKVKLFPIGSRQKSAHLCDFQESILILNLGQSSYLPTLPLSRK